MTIQRLLACGEGPRVSAGPWGWLRGSGRQAQGSELLQSTRSEGAHSAFLESGQAGAVGMGDGLISWESDAGSHARFAQADGPVGRLGWERAVVDMVGPAVSCLAHVEVR